MTPTITRDDLTTVEEMTFTMALAQVLRGDDPGPHTAMMLTLTLARLLGEHDWTKVEAPDA